jgi:hypothetical protein
VALSCGVALQADETLAKFLDFCTYGHMIDNVVLIVTGTLHERDVQVRCVFACLCCRFCWDSALCWCWVCTA